MPFSFRSMRFLPRLARFQSTGDPPLTHPEPFEHEQGGERLPVEGSEGGTGALGSSLVAVSQIALALAVPGERVGTPIDPGRVPQKKALLIGICRVEERPESQKDKTNWTIKFGNKRRGSFGTLKGPHREVEDTKNLLVNTYGYDPGDIVILTDSEGQSDDLRPTRDNIVTRIKHLVVCAKAGDHFYFHFSGHSDQIPTKDPKEEDGMNECILSCDGYRIVDDDLRTHLVDRIPEGAYLTAVFDSCHSGSLLDLYHWRCNRVYVPWINKGSRKTKSLWNITKRKLAAIVHLVHRSESTPSQPELGGRVSRKPTFETQESGGLIEPFPSEGWTRAESPQAEHCEGDCQGSKTKPSAIVGSRNVICLSSAADGQKAYEDENGTSMTFALIKILEENPRPTLAHVLANVSFALHQQYMDLHIKARHYRRGVHRANLARRALGKLSIDGMQVEMNDFQDPQLSSHEPLDMTQSWNP